MTCDPFYSGSVDMKYYCKQCSLNYIVSHLRRKPPWKTFIVTLFLVICSVVQRPVEPPATVHCREPSVTRTGLCPAQVESNQPQPSHLAREPVETLLFVVYWTISRRHDEHVAAVLACMCYHR